MNFNASVFKTYEDCIEIECLFVYMNKRLEKVKPNKKFFFEKFKEDRLELMTEFVILNNINFRKPADIIKLIKFYNHLPEY